MAQTYATEVKLFNKWSFDDIQVDDISLEVGVCKFYSLMERRFRACKHRQWQFRNMVLVNPCEVTVTYDGRELFECDCE